VKYRATVLALVALLVAPYAAAVEKRQAADWTKQLQRTSSLLKERKYEEALPKLSKLLRQMLDVLGPGDEATYVLAIPLIQRAVAEAGAGDHASALWHWQMAQTMYPKTAEADLSMFGGPGAFLKANLLSNPRPESCPRGEDETTPPAVTKSVTPSYPEGARLFRNSGFMIIHVTVDATGVPRQARIVKPLAAPLIYSTLEAIRLWKFTPATRAGVPVEAGFCITINYKLK
jgi:TonB family protein